MTDRAHFDITHAY